MTQFAKYVLASLALAAVFHVGAAAGAAKDQPLPSGTVADAQNEPSTGSDPGERASRRANGRLHGESHHGLGPRPVHQTVPR